MDMIEYFRTCKTETKHRCDPMAIAMYFEDNEAEAEVWYRYFDLSDSEIEIVSMIISLLESIQIEEDGSVYGMKIIEDMSMKDVESLIRFGNMDYSYYRRFGMMNISPAEFLQMIEENFDDQYALNGILYKLSFNHVGQGENENTAE